MSHLGLVKIGAHGDYYRVRQLASLLITYFLLRLFFQQVVVAKIGFIYPTGLLVNWFFHYGEFDSQVWIFGIERTRFVLGASCSGTTFFSLLVAYLVYRSQTHVLHPIWFVLAYPITLLANAIRVASSIATHQLLNTARFDSFQAQAHVLTGVITFFFCFILVAYLIERRPSKECV